MDIKSAETSFRDITHGDSTYERLINHLSSARPGAGTPPYHLSLLIGERDGDKEDTIRAMADATDREIMRVDTNEVISKIESDTFSNLDYVFKSYEASDTLFYLEHGSRLCGVYTGYSQSHVKYATPQERYFLKKIQEHGGLYVIDINGVDDADNSLRRAAQSIISFPPPQSGLKKLIHKLKGTHGYEIKTERPERYNA